MCYGFVGESPGSLSRSPAGFLAWRKALGAAGPKFGLIPAKFQAGDCGDSAPSQGCTSYPDPEGVPGEPSETPGEGAKGGIQGIGPDFSQYEELAKQCPKRAAGKKGASQGSSTAATGGAGTSGVSPSTPSSSGSSSAAGGSGGQPPGGGKGPGKEPPSSLPSVSPRKRPRRSAKKTQAVEEVPAVDETAADAAAALAAVESNSSASVSTLKSAKDVRAITAAARKKAREELKQKEDDAAKAAADAAAAAAAAGMPPPPPRKKSTAAAISKAGTKSVSSASAVAAAPSAPSGYPQYTCGNSCECNTFGREKLRQMESTAGPAEHCRENLAFIRWSLLRRDNSEIKELLRGNRDLLVEQNKLLQDILGHSMEAATVRASVDLAADDPGELGIPWTDMDQSSAAFATMAQRQMLYRVLHRIVCKACHFPRKAMHELFAPPLQQRVHPICMPNSHSRRSSVWKYGRKYHILPKVTLDFIAFVMSKKYTEFSSETASQEIKDHLNDARQAASDRDKETFYGKLDDPVYLLVWRDSEAKCFAIEEPPPFDGDDEAKEAFMERWEDVVNDEIADKHKNGFIHKDPPHP